MIAWLFNDSNHGKDSANEVDKRFGGAGKNSWTLRLHRNSICGTFKVIGVHSETHLKGQPRTMKIAAIAAKLS